MTSREESLRPYRKKRRFESTPEPRGEQPVKISELPIFVIQEHDASRLHYDLRLEIDGALKSWAIPKGPSTDPHVRRLAIMTEDHPMEYATFEGTIPEGNYGAGTVMVWDIGTYENTTGGEKKTVDIAQGVKEGHITFRLHGKKLHGRFALIRGPRQPGRSNQWLFLKMKDSLADPGHDPTIDQPNSALTGRSMDEIAIGMEKRRAA